MEQVDHSVQITPREGSEDLIRSDKHRIVRSSLSRMLLVRGENKRKFEEMRAKILKELLPQTEIENILCDKFISATWKHDRLLVVERNILSAQNAPMPSEEDTYSLNVFPSSRKRRVRDMKKVRLDHPDIQKVLKYQIALEKNMHKLLELIRAEQRLRNSGS